MASRTITVHQVRALLRGARRLGLDPVPLLQAARIPPLLLGDDRARVTPDQFTCLVRELHEATGDEFLGLGPAPSRRGTFAMMCYAAIGCRDLESAVHRAVRFYGLFPDGPDLGLAYGDGELELSVRNDPAFADPFLSECLTIVYHRLCNWLIGRRIPLTRAAFAYPPPPYAAEYPVLYGCPARFDAPRTAVAFAAHWLAAPVIRDEAALEELLSRAPADLLSRRSYGTTVGEQVRHTLAGSLTTGRRRPARLPGLTEVAARLALSPATLRRRLRAEGTSFQELKDAVRRDAALTSLAAGGEPIALLASRLGYSEDTAFHRAFRRWTGTTPGAYRLRQLPRADLRRTAPPHSPRSPAGSPPASASSTASDDPCPP
ncbi:AraC family transcriptional regulator [Streptomyces sp. NPDC051940]|uniref:AraC family transcriptional regulator n=1 Tax=Streptomyces sp. NPDC051940 TaxID=3155675 RepID=UPI0034317B27